MRWNCVKWTTRNPSLLAVAHRTADVCAREADILQHGSVHGLSCRMSRLMRSSSALRDDPPHKSGYDTGNALHTHGDPEAPAAFENRAKATGLGRSRCKRLQCGDFLSGDHKGSPWAPSEHSYWEGLQVQVNLKSSEKCAPLDRMLPPAHHRRGLASQWRGCVGAPPLRGAGAVTRARASMASSRASLLARPHPADGPDWRDRRPGGARHDALGLGVTNKSLAMLRSGPERPRPYRPRRSAQRGLAAAWDDAFRLARGY